jgi:hypothetical protein
VKKIVALFVILSLILCGCGGKPVETTAPATEATEVVTEAPTTVPPTTEAPTEAPTEPPVPSNPLTGEILEAPHETRLFAVTINNVPGAMPTSGVSQADLFFEMYVNDYSTRGLALFADIREATAVGSVRSLRYNFIDICQAYEAIVVHAGGSQQVLNALNGSGVPNVSVELEVSDYYFRDYERVNAGYNWEHTLFVKGEPTLKYAESKGISVTQPAGKTYGLSFREDATPANGENATHITINLTHDTVTKKTIMEYDESLGQYKFKQFNRVQWDNAYKQDICFENVIVMFCNVYNSDGYHIAELEGSGEGYFACNGKIIPIKWVHEKETDPFTFTLADGTPLDLSVGNSYIAIAPLTSTVIYE